MIDFDWANKGRSVKDLPEIIVTENGRESDLSFEYIYELGRLVSEGDEEFAMESIEKIDKCGPVLKKHISNFFGILAEQVLHKNLEFSPLLIDLVVFDPEDAKGERFHIALCSTSAELIEDYRREVQHNIDGNKIELNDEHQERGPILTNNNIYKSPFFYRGPNERSADAPAHFHRLKQFDGAQKSNGESPNSGERMIIYFGSFKAKRENKVSKQIQKAHIELFFDIIEDELRLGKGLIKENDHVIAEPTFEFNTSLLVPLLRPAASFVGDKDFRLRGGGLFVYGHTDSGNSHIEMVARLQHFFYRNILNESHTQIVYDYLRHEGANHYIHDFKSFLTSELTNKITRVLNRNKLDPTDQAELSDVVNQVNSFGKYLNKILEAYRDFIEPDERKTRIFNSGNMEAVLNDLNRHNKGLLEVAFVNEINDGTAGFNGKSAIVEKIFRNLYDNSITEYEKLGIPFADRKAFVRWDNEEDPEILTISYFNKDLKMKGIYLRDFGTKPLGESGSTGLGGYFINNTLSWMLAEENKFSDEITTNIKRFIKCENLEDGILFSFKFRLQRR